MVLKKKNLKKLKKKNQKIKKSLRDEKKLSTFF